MILLFLNSGEKEIYYCLHVDFLSNWSHGTKFLNLEIIMKEWLKEILKNDFYRNLFITQNEMYLDI